MHEDVCSACYWRNFKKNIDSMNRVDILPKEKNSLVVCAHSGIEVPEQDEFVS